jgi:hypothetical protein
VLFISWNNILFNIKVCYCSFRYTQIKIVGDNVSTGFSVVIFPVVCGGMPLFLSFPSDVIFIDATDAQQYFAVHLHKK